MPVVSSPWNSVTPVARQKLVLKVCRLFGLDDSDPDFAQVALDNLDDTINDMNTALFDFNKSQETGIALVENQPYVDISSLFYRESQAYLVDNNSQVQAPLDFLDWLEYKRWFGDDSATGCPGCYSLFNTEETGRVHLSPTPDANSAATYTLTVESYRRIPAVSSVRAGGHISVPREVESALVYGAQKRMAIHILGAGHNDVGALAGLEMQALERLKRVDKTHPDLKKRFVLGDFSNRRGWRRFSNTAFIKI